MRRELQCYKWGHSRRAAPRVRAVKSFEFGEGKLWAPLNGPTCNSIALLPHQVTFSAHTEQGKMGPRLGWMLPLIKRRSRIRLEAEQEWTQMSKAWSFLVWSSPKKPKAFWHVDELNAKNKIVFNSFADILTKFRSLIHVGMGLGLINVHYIWSFKTWINVLPLPKSLKSQSLLTTAWWTSVAAVSNVL